MKRIMLYKLGSKFRIRFHSKFSFLTSRFSSKRFSSSPPISHNFQDCSKTTSHFIPFLLPNSQSSTRHVGGATLYNTQYTLTKCSNTPTHTPSRKSSTLQQRGNSQQHCAFCKLLLLFFQVFFSRRQSPCCFCRGFCPGLRDGITSRSRTWALGDVQFRLSSPHTRVSGVGKQVKQTSHLHIYSPRGWVVCTTRQRNISLGESSLLCFFGGWKKFWEISDKFSA